MLTEPTPLQPRGGRRRVRLLLGSALPPVLLIAVVGSAILGGATDTDLPTAAPSAPGSLATSAPGVDGTPSGPRSGRPDPARVVPVSAMGLLVLGVDAALERQASGDRGVMAISGRLAMSSGSGACGSAADPDRRARAFSLELGVVSTTSTFCDRVGILRPTDTTLGPAAAPHIHFEMTIGAVVPDLAAGADQAPVPAVFIGRFLARQPSCKEVRACEPRFQVDGIVWVDGLWRGPTVSVEPPLLMTGLRLASRVRDRLAAEVTDPSEALLLETLVTPTTLTRLDPAAATVAAAAGDPHDRIWYRRSLDRSIGVDPVVRWVAIDDVVGAIVGSGVVTD